MITLSDILKLKIIKIMIIIYIYIYKIYIVLRNSIKYSILLKNINVKFRTSRLTTSGKIKNIR